MHTYTLYIHLRIDVFVQHKLSQRRFTHGPRYAMLQYITHGNVNSSSITSMQGV